MILCIDPGLRGLGIAAFDGDKLRVAAYLKNPVEGRGYAAHRALADVAWKFCDTTPERVLIEFPRIYPGMPDKDLNDLLDVAGVGAACAAMFTSSEVESIFPSEWKGNVKKAVMTERIMDKLDPHELARVTGPKFLIHNALDAAGIGLWRLGRLNKKLYPGATP